MAANNGVVCLNAPGTLDSDFRGEVAVVLANFGSEVFSVRRGDRIAQLCVTRVERVEVCEVDELSSSGRGAGGFGSTGA
jgi:dUTP pyrophosphatase